MAVVELNKLLHSYSAMRAAVEKNPALLAEVGELFLANIKEHADCNAFIEVYEEEFRQQIDNSIERFKEGKARDLEGLVVGVKDLFAHQAHGLSGSSKILEGFVSTITATSVERLLEAGAIIIGRQNCDEFGMGTGNENSVYGPVKNGLAKDRVPGGSSGGSAVAVQMGMCHISLGSDTGGSVRQPAAFCGIWGYRPTYGLISRYGLVAYASSFDTVGILAHNPEDIAITSQVMAGADGRDNTMSTKPIPSYKATLTRADTPKSMKIAYLKDSLSYKGIQDEVQVATQRSIDNLKAKGHQVEGVAFPFLDYVLPVYYVLTTAEASANLACYDGVRYGYRASGVSSYEEMIKKTRSLGFGTEVKRRILLGTFILSAEYQDAYYRKAQKVRRKIKEALDTILTKYDYIILPTAPTTAYPIGSHQDDPMKNYLADLYTVIAAVAGLPAIALPNGHDAQGLPIGLQVIGSAFDDDKLLAFAQASRLTTP